MIVIIAQIRNFSLRRQIYLVEHKYTTHDIEIVKIENNSTNNKSFCYTIASFNEAGELCSCGSRLLENIETEEDLTAIKELEEIGRRIINIEEVYTDYISED